MNPNYTIIVSFQIFEIKSFISLREHVFHTVLCIHLNKGVALMNQYHLNAQQPSAWRFFVYSLVAYYVLIPFTINGNNTNSAHHVHLAICSIIGRTMPRLSIVQLVQRYQ